MRKNAGCLVTGGGICYNEKNKERVRGMIILILLIAFGASVIGAVCGIGGGVIIKPVLDAFGVAGVAEISFLSGCTVLSMSCYSVCRSVIARESLVNFQTGTPLAVGAALGGILGKSLFSALQTVASQPEAVGGYQAICLAAVTAATLTYTLNKGRIPALQIRNGILCAAVGLALGVMSSFLGIGGGPINLVVLYYFFSMETKTAAQNSLYIILVSQLTSLLTAILTGSVPTFDPLWLVVTVLGGIAGGVVGRKVNKHLTQTQVDKLFTGLIFVIITISIYNAVRYL